MRIGSSLIIFVLAITIKLPNYQDIPWQAIQSETLVMSMPAEWGQLRIYKLTLAEADAMIDHYRAVGYQVHKRGNGHIERIDRERGPPLLQELHTISIKWIGNVEDESESKGESEGEGEGESESESESEDMAIIEEYYRYCPELTSR